MRHTLSSLMICAHCCATELRQSSRRRGLINWRLRESHRQTGKSCSLFRAVRDVLCARNVPPVSGCVQNPCPAAPPAASAPRCPAGVPLMFFTFMFLMPFRVAALASASFSQPPHHPCGWSWRYLQKHHLCARLHTDCSALTRHSGQNAGSPNQRGCECAPQTTCTTFRVASTELTRTAHT